MTDIPRRTFVWGAAWSIPVIAAAVAVPQAAASTVADVFPAKCIRVTENHGHGGNPGNKDWWQGIYTDGTTTELMSNGEAMSHKVWGPLCRDAKHDK